MDIKPRILAISGSTRKTSSNLHLIKAIANLTSDIFAMEVFEGLTDIPHFNPDLDRETDIPPPQVANFRKQVSEADGVLICTPEYAIGVPGTLKNALDWTVSSLEFSKKPVGLVTASLAGGRAHESLLGTLLIIEARITRDSQVLLSGIKKKVNERGEITDAGALEKVRRLAESLRRIVGGEDLEYLPAPEVHYKPS